ncbi:MAG: GHKL domain-containing protein [Clostridiales bacterium]|nr:GHKL domain-containing protein [Clostridiales bacterium]
MNTAALYNTPGYYYAIAYSLSALVIAITNPRKIKKWKLGVISLCFLLVLLWFMSLTSGARQLIFVLSVVVIIGLLLGYLYMCCDFRLREAAYYCVKAFIYGEFSASLCWQIYFYFLWDESSSVLNLWHIIEMTTVYAILYAIMFFLERYLKKDMDEINITLRELFAVIVIGLSVFCGSNLSYLDKYGLFSGRMAMDVYIIRTLVDLSGVAILYAYHIQVKEMQIHFERDTLQQIMEMQYKNYQISQEGIDLVNQKYHDMKHQIAILKAEADSARATRHLEKMEDEIRIYETQNKTGNQVLDAVLTGKSIYCQKHQIELKFIVEGELLSFMDEMDISALFGNMLENAIESAEKQSDPAKRLIRMRVVGEKQFLRICIENYCDEIIRFRNGMPITTKADKHLHGFGMKSIRKTVEKYGGSAVADQKNNWFELKILIPLEKKETG